MCLLGLVSLCHVHKAGTVARMVEQHVLSRLELVHGCRGVQGAGCAE